jgi:kinesin family member 6/9
MTGDTQNYEHRGIAPRSISQIFSEINSRVEFEYKISCTYCEIYNEKFFDLLADLSNPDLVGDYTIIEEKDGRGVFVRGLTEITVTSETEALNLLFSGELARTTAMHKLNRKSNRSHSVFTVYLQQRLRSGVSERITHSKLHLIDLAGSERLKKTLGHADGITGEEVTRKESMQINQSLTYLEQCVVALARRGSHIPYRQSKLTNILKDCLGANCNTLMLACIWGESTHLEETVSTLRLASRMMHVQNETVAVETVDPDALIKKQAKLIKALKQELLMHDALVERTGVAYEPYTPEQQMNIAQMLERYIDSPEAEEEDVLNISSYRQMIEICKQFKKMVQGARAETAMVRDEAMKGIAMGYPEGRMSPEGDLIGGGTASYMAENRIAGEFDPKAPYVGETAGPGARGGFALGTSGANSRPAGGVEGIARFAPRAPGAGPGAGFNASAGAGLAESAKNSPSRAVDALNQSTKRDLSARSINLDGMNLEDGSLTTNMDGFIRGAGSELHENFMRLKSQVKDLKTRCKDIAAAVNDSKMTIDSLQGLLEQRKAARIETLRRSGLKPSEAEDIVDEEEFQLMKELREAKRSYKNGYEQLQKTRIAAQQAAGALEASKLELVEAFNNSGGAMRGTFGTDTFGATDTGPLRRSVSPGTAGAGAAANDADSLDDQEAFDRMEEDRVLATDPDSLAFFHAQKTKKANLTQNFASLKQMQRNKRAI